jgi:uncharacterized protein Yka (UPF0111/DUF47 family)
MQEEYGDAIQVILVESQGTGFHESVGFAMRYEWLGGQAIWTSDYLFPTSGRGLPKFALLSPTGEIVLTGNSVSMHGQIEDAIEEMVKSGAEAPEDAPKAVEKAYSDLAKERWAKAHEDLSKALDKVKTDADRAAVQTALDGVATRVERKVARVHWLAENGYPQRAEELAETLQKGTKDADALAEMVAPLAGLLVSEAFQAELAAGKELEKLEEKLFADATNEKLVEKLLELAEEHAGTQVAERARNLVEVAGYAIKRG